jgi:signal transduction histidine kinase
VSDDRFSALVGLACHDLRTPLATVSGFAKTLVRTSELGERDAKFVELIDEAADEMRALVDQLALAARIASGRYEPVPLEADTLELASASVDGRVRVVGEGAVVETDGTVVARALGWLASAALRFGELDEVTWTVAGRDLALAPVTRAAAAVVEGGDRRDLGALVALSALEALGASFALDGETLRVRI